MISIVTKDQRKREISMLFERQTAATAQLAELAGSNYRANIINGILDQLEVMQGDISRHFSVLLGQDKYSPSVRHEIKKLLSGQNENLKTLRLAVKADPEKTKMIGRWLFENNLRLKGLSGLF